MADFESEKKKEHRKKQSGRTFIAFIEYILSVFITKIMGIHLM